MQPSWPTAVAGPLHAAVSGTAYPTAVSAETVVGHGRMNVKNAKFSNRRIFLQNDFLK
jgi:hypothetical protein